MHIFLWFGWSIAWSVFCFFPLFRRLIGTLSGGAPVQQRQGSIRLLLGGIGAVCASSGLAALFSAERGAATADAIGSAATLQGNTFGHAFSAGLTGLFGYWGAIVALAVLGAASLPWLFRLGRSARNEADDDTLAAAPLYAAQLRDKSYDGGRLDGVTAMPAASNTVGARISERKIQRDNNVAARRTGPWKLPGAPAAGSGYDARSPASAQSAMATQTQTATRRAPWSGAANKQEAAPPPRNESQWAPFESLRPTAAMMARSQKLAAGEQGRGTRAGMPVPPTRAGLLASRPASAVVKPAVSVSGAAAATITTASTTTTPTQGSAQTSAFPSIPARAPSPLAVHVPLPLPPQALTAIPASISIAPTATTSTAAPAVPYLAPKAPASSSWPWAADAPATSSSNAAAGARDVEVQQVANTPSAPSTPGFYTHGPASPGIRLPQNNNDNNDDDNRPDMILPSLSLLDAGGDERFDIPAAQLEETGRLIEQRLKEFKVPVTVLGAYSGPVITRYEVEPALGVRGAQIVNLMKDLSRALGLTSIRVVETIPGKTCMGLELPNSKRQMIRLAEIFESDAYRHSDSRLTLAMGKDITGLPVVTDLARAPHMLVAGTTGSGKSVAINAMILSLLYKSTPQEVRLIMIDPKMLELSVYDGIPHLLAPVVTDMKLAGNALTWCVTEMDKRYRLMSALGVRNLAGYNQKIHDGIAAEKRVKNPFSLTPDAPEPLDTLPLIVVVIDELADLMMVTGKKIEELIARLAQKARAAGIHLILATQRPSVDVITGLIKANIPTRVAFQVSSKIDSRTVLDQMGAEALLGHGDMLFLPPGSGYPQRVHGAFVSDQEVHRVVQYLKSFGEPDYEEAILSGPPGEMADSDLAGEIPDPEADPLYDEAVAFVARTRRASISSVQRQFRVGYNRAARLVEQMEAAGILSSMATNGSRDVLVPPQVE